ncbi:hypothetical protein UFOVP1309_62 [uncultured Caudovirales phage]|uniref:Uncharacterized protein n=1 Tax=uncultured Caudovirales phage TaxID=2100421 RepID=A0A6J5RXB7_9CAUD|nr:hypothetical protein UFOVP1309_62 [uncultured Caudovirales phage]
MNTDKENYEAAIRARDAAKYMLDLKRCISCDNLDQETKVCRLNGAVPEEFLHSPSECTDYFIIVPF